MTLTSISDSLRLKMSGDCFMPSEIACWSVNVGGDNSATELTEFKVAWVFRTLHKVRPASFGRYLCRLLIISSVVLHSLVLLLTY